MLKSDILLLKIKKSQIKRRKLHNFFGVVQDVIIKLQPSEMIKYCLLNGNCKKKECFNLPTA